MIDGLTVTVRADKLQELMGLFENAAVYSRAERMMDCEKHTFYLPRCCVWTLMLYFDPRRDQEHKHPRRIILHHVMTQFENFMFHQLSSEALRAMELEMLSFALSLEPQNIYFDLMLGVWDTKSWSRVFPFYPLYPTAQDFHLVKGRVKFVQYDWNGLTLKFYRLNPDANRNHQLKYPLGWAGYTKCEFVSPRFGDWRTPLMKSELPTIEAAFKGLQNIREVLLGEVWMDRNRDVSNKTFARSDRIFAWSSTETPLQGSMKLFESEMTRRKLLKSPQPYLSWVKSVFKELADAYFHRAKFHPH